MYIKSNLLNRQTIRINAILLILLSKPNIMKTAYVPFIADLESMSDKQLAIAMELQALRQYIDCAPWEKYPYKPITVFDIAASSSHLFIRFFVHGLGLKAEFDKTNSPVWEDSCVEIFIGDENGLSYRNFELNCIGTLLSSQRDGKDKNIVFMSETEAETIIRRTSLSSDTFKEIDGIHQWSLTVGIPFTSLGLANRPSVLRANFYKCADGSKYRHYVCWSPVNTDKPDFHRPEFFGTLIFNPQK